MAEPHDPNDTPLPAPPDPGSAFRASSGFGGLSGPLDLGSSGLFGPVSSGPDDPPPGDSPPSPDNPADPDLDAVVAGRYRLLRRVGRGGMAVVYAARDLELKRTVAVKVVRHEGVDPALFPELARRFDREARITAQLQHPAIPPVHDLGQLPDGRPFLVMKLVKGCTLAELLRDRPSGKLGTELPQLLQTFEHVCQAVGYAHSRGVIHRDLSPHNVMIGAFGEVQVMDWGLGKVLPRDGADRPETVPGTDDETDKTVIDADRAAGAAEGETESALGKFAYMPPEQAGGENARVDRRADVFGLGAILCELLTGRPPYTGSRLVVRAAATLWHTEEAFARLDASGADAELVELARRCLAKDPADRPADAAEVAAAAANYRAGVDGRLRRAELEKAAAEAAAAEATLRAEAEERAKEAAEAAAAEQGRRRRTQVTLLGTVTILVGVLATGFAMKADADAEKLKADARERERRDKTESYVSTNLGLAREHRETGEKAARDGDLPVWAAEVGKAREVLGRADDTADRAELSGLLRSKLDDERGRLGSAVEDLAFATRLDALAESPWARYPGDPVREKYAAAFRDYRGGMLDPLGPAPEEVGRRVAAHPMAWLLLAALADWQLHADAAERDRLAAVLDHAAPPARPFAGRWAEYRADPEAVARGEVGEGPLPARAVEFFAAQLRLRGRDEAALRLLARGLKAHQKDCRLLVRVGDAAAATLAARGVGRLAVPGSYAGAFHPAARPEVAREAAEHLRDLAVHRRGQLLGVLAEGHARLLAGETRAAADAFDRAARLDDHSPDAWAGVRDAAFLLGDFAAARDAARRVVELADRDPAAHAAEGFLLSLRVVAGLGGTRLVIDPPDPSAVRACYERALARDPRHPPALVGLARLLAREGDHPAAARHCRTLFGPGGPGLPAGGHPFRVEAAETVLRAALEEHPGPGEPDRAGYRALALDLLRTELRERKAAASAPDPGLTARAELNEVAGWGRNRLFRLTAGPLARLAFPADERAAWAEFWADALAAAN